MTSLGPQGNYFNRASLYYAGPKPEATWGEAHLAVYRVSGLWGDGGEEWDVQTWHCRESGTGLGLAWPWLDKELRRKVPFNCYTLEQMGI